MTLLETIRLIEDIASRQPNVNSIVKTGDIFDLNKDELEQKYSAVCVTQRTHNFSATSFTFNFTIYYVDRLTLDEKNKSEIQSTGCNVLANVINELSSREDIFVNYGDITTFTERFTSLCAGAFINIGIQTMRNVCVDEEKMYKYTLDE